MVFSNYLEGTLPTYVNSGLQALYLSGVAGRHAGYLCSVHMAYKWGFACHIFRSVCHIFGRNPLILRTFLPCGRPLYGISRGHIFWQIGGWGWSELCSFATTPKTLCAVPALNKDSLSKGASNKDSAPKTRNASNASMERSKQGFMGSISEGSLPSIRLLQHP